jgi:DNA primase
LSATTGSDNKATVLAATDIVELVGQTVSLRKRGKDYVGLCPFHQEKTPSFKVDPVKHFFYCFGCKASGNAIDFVMKRDRVEFIDALRTLADRAGIELTRGGGEKQDKGLRQLLLDAQSSAASLFEKWLNDATTGRAAREYLSSRGFTTESVKRFQIGYVPDAWDSLLRGPVMKKYEPGILLQAGLVKSRESGGHYDTFRNRLMFPIRDETGRIIAFGGRAMPGSEDPAKYLNSPETPLFSKSRSIYGLDLARQKIVETRTVAVVEGYTDVVMAHQYGAGNVVSILGTAMTEQHVSILRRFADRIVLLFDADTAGETAVNRAVELFLTQPVEIAIASIPEDLDPDEYLLKHGADGFAKLLNEASDALTYKWKQLDREFQSGDLTTRQKSVEQYLEVIAGARGTGPIDSIRWGQVLSRVSRLTEIPVEDLNKRFKTTRKDPQPLAPSRSREAPKTAQERAERWILGSLLLHPGKWHDVQQHVHAEEFTGDLRRIAEVYWTHQRDEGEPTLAEFVSLVNDELKPLAIELAEEVEAMEGAEQTLDGALKHLKEERDRREVAKLTAETRRTTSQDEQNFDVDVLRKLSEKMSRPDLRRQA